MSNGLLNGLTEAWLPDASNAFVGQQAGLNSNSAAGFSYVAQAGFPGGHAIEHAGAPGSLVTAASTLLQNLGATDFLSVHWCRLASGITGKDSALFQVGETNDNGFDVGPAFADPVTFPVEIVGEIPCVGSTYSATVTSTGTPFTADAPHMVALWYTAADATLHMSLDGGTVFTVVNADGIGAKDATNFASFNLSGTGGAAQLGMCALWQGQSGVANAVAQLGGLYSGKLAYSAFDAALVVKSERWDAVFAPALPAGWVAAAAIVTETAGLYSEPNGLSNPVNVTTNIAYWNTDLDGNGGNAQASHIVLATAFSVSLLAYALCRMRALSTTQTGLTCYGAAIDYGGALSLHKWVAGAHTVLGSVATTLALNVYYRVTCACVGTAITLRCQRLSDLKWVDGANTWHAAQQDALSVTDGGISGAGRAGIALSRFGAGDLLSSDDFVFERVGAMGGGGGAAHPRLISVRNLGVSLS